MVPKQHSSGGKNRLGNISKQGDRYLRGLFVAGALSVIRYAKVHGTKHRPWLTALLARRPTKVAAIALANKIARMVWANMRFVPTKTAEQQSGLCEALRQARDPTMIVLAISAAISDRRPASNEPSCSRS